MPRPSASATASRFADHWVADALAADHALDFSAITALLDASPESLAGAPESVTERVALRCLQELSDAATGDGRTASRPAAGVLRVDVTRSCEDLLLQIVGEAGTSGSLRKDMLPALSEDIQNIICIKKPRLPETCFELLREVDQEIACMALPSPGEQNGDKEHDPLNIEEPQLSTDNDILRVETLANLVNRTDRENILKASIEPTSDLQQGCISDTIIPRVGSNQTHLSSPQNDSGEKAKASIEPTSDFQQGCISDTIIPRVGSNQTHLSSPQNDSGEKAKASIEPTSDLQQGCISDTIIPGVDSNQTHLSSPQNDSGEKAKASIEPTSDLQQGYISDTIIPRVDSNQTHQSTPQNDSGEKANQDLDYEGTSFKPVEKVSIHEELAQQTGRVLPSVRCNGAIQGDKSETNHMLGKEHAAIYEQLNDGNCHLEICCADKVNQSIFGDGDIPEKNMAVCRGLSVQNASGPHNCTISEVNCLSEQNNAKRTSDVQKLSCSMTVPIPPRDGDGRRTRQILNKETLASTVVETSHVHSPDDSLSGSADKMPYCIKDQGTNSSPKGCSEKDLCIKCSKDGLLLKCNSCLLAAHESCFGPSVTFQDSGEFCCPVCFYTKASKAYKEAKKTYCEARKNLAGFLGSQQLINQHDEQPPEVLPRAFPSKGHLNEYSSVKRKNSHHTETDRLACSDEKADQQRKKQKTNTTIDTCEEIITGKAPSVRNSGVEPMKKHSVLQNVSRKVHDAQKEQEVENTCEEARNENSCDGTRNTYRLACSDEKADQQRKKQKTNTIIDTCEETITGKAPSVRNSGVEPMNKHSVLQNVSRKVHDAQKEQELENTCEEARNENSCDGTRNASHEKCGPSATNQEGESDKEDGLMNCNQSEHSGETEAISNDSGQRSLPILHNIRHHEARLQQRETQVSFNSGKATVQRGQHMPSPSRKRNYAYPINRPSDQVAPTGRRSRLYWTDEEEETLREAMEKFKPQDNNPIPWVQILEYGRDVFHRARKSSDLRVKWRHMMAKAGS